MQALNWNDLRYFLEVVQAGSLSQAADHLKVNQTTVSRRIIALEKQLGVQLFDRVGNGWVITAIGERLVASAENMAEETNTIERFVMADNQELSGKLRVTVADVCTQYLMMPTIQAFVSQYPEVDLEIIATRNELDLAAREADVALRSTDKPPPNLVGRRISQLAYNIYGNREYLEKVRLDPDSCGLACITWVGDGVTRPAWIEKNFPKSKRVYRTSELGIMLQMARLGTGITQIPCALGDPDPLLYRIPVEYIESGWGLWVLSHVDLRKTARVRIFRDFLVKELKKQKNLIEGRLTTNI